jgi:acyl-homoserine-lactone acylase
MAWSHTTAPGFGYTVYRLALAKGSPTTYMVDGRRVPMTSRRVTVTVRRRDGRLAQVARRLWSTRWGPVLGADPSFANLAWTRKSAFVLADAAVTNVRALDTWLALGRAQSAPAALRALERHQGIPWNDTVVADRGGRALFADVRVAPNVSNRLAARCSAVTRTLPPFRFTGLAVLDGSRSACRWGTDRDAVEPGRMAAGRQPHLFRRDYVTNSNDSYWLVNPHHPLEGFPRIMGDERTPRTLRTRAGLLMTQARVDGSDGLGPAGFTRTDMQRLVFSNRPHAGELARDALVAACRALPGGVAPTSEGAAVPVGDACEVLARWDLRDDLDSRGAVLFRRFWNDLAERNEPDSWWARPFDPRDPVRTPGVFDTTRPGVMTALGDAIGDLQAAGVGARRARRRRPVHARRWAPHPRRGRAGRPERRVQHDRERVRPRARLRPGAARLVLRAGGDLARRPVPGFAHDPHVLAIREPAIALLVRPATDVQPQGLGARALLPRGRARAHAGHDGPRTPSAIMTIARRTAGAERARRAGSASRTSAT